MSDDEHRTYLDALEDHEQRDGLRHDAVMGAVGDLRTAIQDLRAQNARGVGAALSEWGTDTVPVPLTGGGSLKLRTLYGLVFLIVGSLIALGIGGDTVAGWVDAYVGANAGAVEAPPELTP